MSQYAVIGAGTMGSGIAQKIALEGGQVIVVDVSSTALEKARQGMERIFQESLQRRLISKNQLKSIWQRIQFTQELEQIAEAELIIEAVFEDLNLKKRLFADLEQIVSPETILTSNTSSLRLADVAAEMEHPERFLGLHFFYHPVKNRLLEIIPAPSTSPEALQRARLFNAFLGKVDLVCRDRPGFVVNRFFVPWLNEAVRLLGENRATIGEIELTAKEGFQLGMGPFELMNVTGVPIAYHAARSLAEYLGPFYQPHPLLEQQATQGLWALGKTERAVPYVFQRLLAVTVVVAATLIEEGVGTAADVEIGAQVGLRWRKGPLALYNSLSSREREELLAVFRERYPDMPVPATLRSGASFSIPVVQTNPTDAGVEIRLSRPAQTNALNEAVFTQLAAALEQNSDASLVILSGHGKNFAAGADIKFFIRRIEAGKIDEIVSFTRKAQEVLRRLDEFPGKVVAVVDGFALGGGAELMLCADLIIATPRARIGFPETGIGIYPALGGTYRLTKRVGEGLARYLIGTGRIVDGTTAQAIGLVDACLPPEKITPEVINSLKPHRPESLPPEWYRIADFMEHHDLLTLLKRGFIEDWQKKIQASLRKKAPLALQAAFRLIAANQEGSLAEAYQRELADLPRIFRTQDALEGLKSVGGPPPAYHGR